jgi:hypothetical protein
MQALKNNFIIIILGHSPTNNIVSNKKGPSGPFFIVVCFLSIPDIVY